MTNPLLDCLDLSTQQTKLAYVAEIACEFDKTRERLESIGDIPGPYPKLTQKVQDRVHTPTSRW